MGDRIGSGLSQHVAEMFQECPGQPKSSQQIEHGVAAGLRHAGKQSANGVNAGEKVWRCRAFLCGSIISVLVLIGVFCANRFPARHEVVEPIVSCLGDCIPVDHAPERHVSAPDFISHLEDFLNGRNTVCNGSDGILKAYLHGTSKHSLVLTRQQVSGTHVLDIQPQGIIVLVSQLRKEGEGLVGQSFRFLAYENRVTPFPVFFVHDDAKVSERQ